MFYPGFVMLIVSLILALLYKQKRIFEFIAIFSPFIALSLLKLATHDDAVSLRLVKYSLSFDFTEINILFGQVVLIILPCIHLYALSVNKKLEIIIGTLYAGFTLFCIFASDLLSILISIELMMVASSIIIFIGGKKNSLRDAKKYFITHLVSGSMIIIGITHIMTVSNSTNVMDITSLFKNSLYSPLYLNIMFTGFIINVAAFPFSGWMVNCYSSASQAGFIYLISFTTKVNTLLMVKLFSSYDLLKYVGIIMILYAGVKAILENHLQKLLCYFSIIQIGFILIACSMSPTSSNMITLIVSFLITHLIYKALLSIVCATLIDHYDISTCKEIKNTKSTYLNIALLIGIIAMIPIPIMYFRILEFKYIISSAINDEIISWFIYLTIIPAIIIALPIREFIHHKNNAIKKPLSYFNIASLWTLSIVLVIIGIFIPYNIPPLTYDYHHLVIKYGSIIIISGLISYLNIIPKKETGCLNIIEIFGNYFFLHFDKWTINSNNKFDYKEYLLPLMQQYIYKLKLAHSQKAAIYIVFTIFVLLLIVFLYTFRQF